MTPPAYGIDFVDRQPAQKMAESGQHGLSLESPATPVGNGPIQKTSAMTGGERSPGEGRDNTTGLPFDLKTGVESLSGVSMDDVRVHHHSAKPAQLQAKAYTQGSDIHVGPGQERHLPHEAWHVVQQKQGRVEPTIQAKGIAINDDAGLEQEADVMGRCADTVQRREAVGSPSSAGALRAPVIQRTITGSTTISIKPWYTEKEAVEYIMEKAVFYRRNLDREAVRREVRKYTGKQRSIKITDLQGIAFSECKAVETSIHDETGTSTAATATTTSSREDKREESSSPQYTEKEESRQPGSGTKKKSGFSKLLSGLGTDRSEITEQVVGSAKEDWESAKGSQSLSKFGKFKKWAKWSALRVGHWFKEKGYWLLILEAIGHLTAATIQIVAGISGFVTQIAAGICQAIIGFCKFFRAWLASKFGKLTADWKAGGESGDKPEQTKWFDRIVAFEALLSGAIVGLTFATPGVVAKTAKLICGVIASVVKFVRGAFLRKASKRVKGLLTTLEAISSLTGIFSAGASLFGKLGNIVAPLIGLIKTARGTLTAATGKGQKAES